MRRVAQSSDTAGDAYPHVAYVRVTPGGGAGGRDDRRGEWLAACYRLTARVERVSAWDALLDLGVCGEDEALAATRTLLCWLGELGMDARAGVGPGLALAQLAALTAPVDAPLAHVSRAAAPAFLRGVPVSALVQMHPRGSVTPEIIERLQRYGLRTLGHVARLGEPALRRQFGAAGGWLAAVAGGQDARPLQPTPQPALQHFRLRFSLALQPAHALATLPTLAERVAANLRRQGRQARELCLTVRWESGSVTRARLTLRQHTHDPALLAAELRRLLVPSIRSETPGSRATAIEELRLALSDFATTVPEQATMWRTQAQRLRAALVVADTLTRRHGRSLLLAPRLTAPAAVFAEERYRLAALATDTSTEPAASMPGAGSAARLRAVDAWERVPQRLHWW